MSSSGLTLADYNEHGNIYDKYIMSQLIVYEIIRTLHLKYSVILKNHLNISFIKNKALTEQSKNTFLSTSCCTKKKSR